MICPAIALAGKPPVAHFKGRLYRDQ